MNPRNLHFCVTPLLFLAFSLPAFGGGSHLVWSEQGDRVQFGRVHRGFVPYRRNRGHSIVVRDEEPRRVLKKRTDRAVVHDEGRKPVVKKNVGPAAHDGDSKPVVKKQEVSSEELPAVDLTIPADWKPHTREWTRAYGAAANGDVDEARRRVARGEGTIDDVRYGWADYLYQQQRIKAWTPVAVMAGLLFLGTALSDASSEPSSGEPTDQEKLISHLQEQQESAESQARSAY